MAPTMTTRPDPNKLPYRVGVGLCLFNKDGLVLIAERTDTPGAWQMPQGGVQEGEDFEVAVFREMKEEIGTNKAEILARHPTPLRYDFPDYMQYRHGIFRGKYSGQEQIWFALRYNGVDADIDLSGKDEPEHPEFKSWRWATLDEACRLIVNFKRPVYEAFCKEFASFAVKKTAS